MNTTIVVEGLFVILLVLILFFVVMIVRIRQKEKKLETIRKFQTESAEAATTDDEGALAKEEVPSVVSKQDSKQANDDKQYSPMDMSPEEAEATAIPFQKPIVVRKERYRVKIHKDPIPETKNIDAECFAYFKGASVLVVEDNLINQKILANVLKKAGIIVDIANNGKEAVAKVKEGKRYDLIIMDISMPEMDGIEATSEIRRHTEYDEIPIVTFTAFNLGPEIRRMFEAGANAYLTKPLNINQLYTVFTLFVGNPKEDVQLDSILELHGLDRSSGVANFEGDEERYRKALIRFYHRYAKSPELFSTWIEHENFERAKSELRDLYADSSAIGAFDVSLFIKEMQKYFIYHNEHLLPRHLLMFRTKLQSLFDAIDVYLDATDAKTDSEEKNVHQDLSPLNES